MKTRIARSTVCSKMSCVSIKKAMIPTMPESKKPTASPRNGRLQLVSLRKPLDNEVLESAVNSLPHAWQTSIGAVMAFLHSWTFWRISARLSSHMVFSRARIFARNLPVIKAARYNYR